MREEIKKTIEVLQNGGVILYPTDTIWGIGCDASNEKAIQKVYEIKKRAESKALIALVGSEVMLERTVIDIPEIAWDLIEVTENPLTIIYESVKGIASNAKAQDGTCAVRLVKSKFCQELIKQFKKPIISTSANTSTAPSPSLFKEIDQAILNKVDYVVNFDQNNLTKSKPSSIIKLMNNGSIKIIR
jgi:L-threonylcarbamoyladenylate synthase